MKDATKGKTEKEEEEAEVPKKKEAPAAAKPSKRPAPLTNAQKASLIEAANEVVKVLT